MRLLCKALALVLATGARPSVASHPAIAKNDLDPDVLCIYSDGSDGALRRSHQSGAFQVEVREPLDGDGETCLLVRYEGIPIGHLDAPGIGSNYVKLGSQLGFLPRESQTLVVGLVDGGPAGDTTYVVIRPTSTNRWQASAFRVDHPGPDAAELGEGWYQEGSQWMFRGPLLSGLPDGNSFQLAYLLGARLAITKDGLELLGFDRMATDVRMPAAELAEAHAADAALRAVLGGNVELALPPATCAWIAGLTSRATDCALDITTEAP